MEKDKNTMIKDESKIAFKFAKKGLEDDYQEYNNEMRKYVKPEKLKEFEKIIEEFKNLDVKSYSFNRRRFEIETEINNHLVGLENFELYMKERSKKETINFLNKLKNMNNITEKHLSKINELLLHVENYKISDNKEIYQICHDTNKIAEQLYQELTH